MRASAELLARVSDKVTALDTPEVRATYRNRDFPRADRVVDLDRRYRWDLLWATGRWIYDDDEFSSLSNDHIDTVLRAVVAPLEES